MHACITVTTVNTAKSLQQPTAGICFTSWGRSLCSKLKTYLMQKKKNVKRKLSK